MPVTTDMSPAYARRAAHFRPSPVRAVWDVSMRAGMISLAGGNPDLAGLPLDELGDLARRLVAEHGTDALQYGSGGGVEALKHELVELMRPAGIGASVDDVLVTAGSQMALQLVTTLLCDPGDVVLAEGPTYVGAINVFEGLEASVVHVRSDADGLVPEALESSIAAVRAQGRTIKFLYTIPNYSNPSGVVTSRERRERVLAICRDAGILVVEDDPYGRLGFDGAVMPALRSMDESVVYLGSMSKIFSPGIRIGWVVAPAELRLRLQIAAETATIHPSVFSQHLALAYLRHTDWQAGLRASIGRYEERARTLVAALERELPDGCRWTVPQGGFFTWVTLPAGVSAQRLFDAAVDEGVAFVTGTAFYAGGRGGDGELRLSFSLETPERIDEGVRRLAAALRRVMA